MSNEKLVLAIQAGDQDRVPELWEQVKRYCFMLINKYKALAEMNVAVSLEDLEQEAYLGMIAAIRRFDPARASFIAILKLCVSDHCREALGIRSKRPKLEHFVKQSLDAPLPGQEVNGLTLLERVEDITLPGMTDALEQDDMKRELREAISRLPYGWDEFMRQHFLEGKPLHDIARDQGVAKQGIYQKKKKAIEKLKRDPSLRMYADLNYFKPKGVSAFHRTGSSTTEDLVIRLEENRENEEARKAQLLKELEELRLEQEASKV